MKCPGVYFYKRKHDKFVLSSIKAFKGNLCSFEKIIHTSYEYTASLKSLYLNISHQ